MPVNIFWKNTEGIYLGCNSFFAHSLGLISPKEIIGKTDYQLPVRKEDSDAYRKDDLQVMNSKKPKFNIQEEQVLENGEEIFLLTSKVPLFNKYHEVIGILGVYSDITELKNTQKSLFEAKKEIEIISQAKSEFITNMSHDIRTPIAGILGIIQDLLNTADEVKSSLRVGGKDTTLSLEILSLLYKLIETIHRDGKFLMAATNELLQFCNEILEVTCLETRVISEGAEHFDLRELIRHNLDLLLPVAKHKKINLSSDIDSMVPKYFIGLRSCLDRIVLNLMSNALKFTQKGFVKVTIKLIDNTQSDYNKGDKVTLQIVIEDSGIGIAKDQFDKIFEQFSRLSPSYEGLYKGAGLGLCLVKRYMDAMRGKIEVKSELDKGSQFILKLPLIVSNEAEISKRAVSSPDPLQTLTSLPVEKMKMMSKSLPTKNALASILVVEDNAAAAMALTVLLKPFKYSIDIAENGVQAVKQARNNTYDLIFVDIGLPDISGIEVAKRIRKFLDTKKSSVPIVALTGHMSDSKKKQECMNAGIQEVMIKPAQPSILESVLQRFIIPKTKVIDWDACLQICSGDVTFAKKLLSMMVQDLKKRTIPTLSDAYSKKNIQALRDELHRSLGSISYLRLPKLEQAIRAFQEVTKVDPYDLQKLEIAYESIHKAIHNFFEIIEKENIV